ncbi:MAG TPA: putative quinol monooxygenase [Jatrophihabitans sp.]|jgi:quinol monooxygenase YgiN|nr:putative quinol monooxygenase [Jatrophihabitans sp.]
MGYVVVATWTAREGEADKVRAILDQLTPGNRAEPKMLHFQASVSTDDPNTFVLFEHYTDPSGYDDHRAGGPFQARVLGEAIPLLQSRKVETFTSLDV